MIRILVAENYELIREGLKVLLANSEVEIVDFAESGEEALRLATTKAYDVVLLDVRINGADGLDCLHKLKLEKPNIPVVMFTAYESASYMARALAFGAAGYIFKSATREELIAALRSVLRGDNIWTKEQLRQAAGGLASPRLIGDAEIALSMREFEVLGLVCRGLTNTQISEALNESYEVVKEAVQSILTKLHVEDRTQAAIWAVRQGIA